MDITGQLLEKGLLLTLFKPSGHFSSNVESQMYTLHNTIYNTTRE